METKKTPLYERQVALGGRLVEFAGFLMPVEFTGVVDEHMSVRREVGIFDVSHMGEISISGDRALDYVGRLTTNDAAGLDPFQAQYTLMLNDDGGVIDDLLVYIRKYDYLLVVNAANTGRVLAWVTDHAPDDVRIENLSEETGLIALQGPGAKDVMSQVCVDNVAGLDSFRSMGATIGDAPCLVSRTGYTGEDGFEIFTNASSAGDVWDTLMDVQPVPKPCGLGARDTLRLEMAFRLHGSDMDESTTPFEAGLGWTVKLDKGDFYGRDALVRQKESGIPKKLIGLRSDARRFARRGSKVRSGGEEIGEVTSGGFSPSLKCGIALAYVRSDYAKRSTDFEIDVRGRLIDAKYEKGPFYRKT
ncbi:MAG: glycine cleavage system aminomethyltransferase GcvT [Candidatus Eisenbacteria bacterium]